LSTTTPTPPSPLSPYTTLFRSSSLPLEDPLTIGVEPAEPDDRDEHRHHPERREPRGAEHERPGKEEHRERVEDDEHEGDQVEAEDRKSTRLNSSHQIISYAVFC